MHTPVRLASKPPLEVPRLEFDFRAASLRLKPVVIRTPLVLNQNLSKRFKANIYLKREDLQLVRSYKIRGAYNMMSSLSPRQLQNGVVCASAGNHAQGFAYSCKALRIKGVVFMPVTTPNQKINQTRRFGDGFLEIKLTGDTFDNCAYEAKQYSLRHNMSFVHPFDDVKVIEGQGTVGVEILDDLPTIDYLFLPVGGGGLAAGVGTYFRTFSPQTKIIGVEPAGAPSMKKALIAGEPVTLHKIDKFVDGAAVQRVGNITFSICKEVLTEMHLIPEGKICSTMLKLYKEEAIITEPAGVLSIAALEDFASEIIGKNVVCIISGNNNDIERLKEIRERSKEYEDLLK